MPVSNWLFKCASVNGIASCNTGACAIQCALAYADCNGNKADGCEVDTRAKAVVSQVAGPRPVARGPAPVPAGPQAPMLDDAIARARTGQGAEVDGGFSFKSKIDLFGNFRNRDVRPGAWLDQVVETTRILFLPAEKDELTGGPGGALEATKYLAGRGITAQTIVFPGLTHFQAYSNTGFEVGSTLAAEWFLKYLGAPAPAKTTTATAVVRR